MSKAWSRHAFWLLASNTLFTALASAIHPAVEVHTGIFHTCAILNDGTVKCWGFSNDGQLGYGNTTTLGDDPNEMGDNLPAVDLSLGRTVVHFAAGGSHNCALFDDSSVKCWGKGSHGQIASGDNSDRGDEPGEMGSALPVVDFGTERTAVSIYAGRDHSCAVLDDGTSKCWGLGLFGRLGYGDTLSRGNQADQMGDNLPTIDFGTSRQAVQIAAGEYHNCAVLNDATVKCWGVGDDGRLGYGNTFTRGDQPSQMGDFLPTVDLGTGRTALSVVVGSRQSCALLDNGQVKCWGYNGDGRLGLGDKETRGDEPNEMGENLPAVALGNGCTAVQIVTSFAHTCALLDNGTLKCWGRGISGRLGYNDTQDRGDQVDEMGEFLPVVELGVGRNATQISSGHLSSHTCALLDDSTIKCWGFGGNGRLGYGDSNDRGGLPDSTGDFLPRVDVGSAPTASPTTATPTTSPTTSSPTASPSTPLPTVSPTTSSPTTSPTYSPTTSMPSSSPTHSPSTSIPTASPTTSAPTTSPLTFLEANPLEAVLLTTGLPLLFIFVCALLIGKRIKGKFWLSLVVGLALFDFGSDVAYISTQEFISEALFGIAVSFLVLPSVLFALWTGRPLIGAQIARCVSFFADLHTRLWKLKDGTQAYEDIPRDQLYMWVHISVASFVKMALSFALGLFALFCLILLSILLFLGVLLLVNLKLLALPCVQGPFQAALQDLDKPKEELVVLFNACIIMELFAESVPELAIVFINTFSSSDTSANLNVFFWASVTGSMFEIINTGFPFIFHWVGDSSIGKAMEYDLYGYKSL